MLVIKTNFGHQMLAIPFYRIFISENLIKILLAPITLRNAVDSFEDYVKRELSKLMVTRTSAYTMNDFHPG